MATPDQFARGGIIDPCACGTPSIVCECGDTRCPTCDPTCTTDQPRRFWRYPASRLTRPRAFQVFRGTDEYCNPTLAVGLPYVGMWVAVTRLRLNAVLCSEGACQEPGCENAAFYRNKEA